LRNFITVGGLLVWKYPNLVRNANVDNDAAEIYISPDFGHYDIKERFYIWAV
jgi:hypothetical protein